jgi:hypothetical protein
MSSTKESLLLSHMGADDWTGWCTVESEPVPPKHFLTKAIFNQLLWDIGVSEAHVHEIYSLNLESFEDIKYTLHPYTPALIKELIPGLSMV